MAGPAVPAGAPLSITRLLYHPAAAALAEPLQHLNYSRCAFMSPWRERDSHLLHRSVSLQSCFYVLFPLVCSSLCLNMWREKIILPQNAVFVTGKIKIENSCS